MNKLPILIFASLIAFVLWKALNVRPSFESIDKTKQTAVIKYNGHTTTFDANAHTGQTLGNGYVVEPHYAKGFGGAVSGIDLKKDGKVIQVISF